MRNNLTHAPIKETSDQIKARLKEKESSLTLPLHDTLELVDELEEFELGRFLLNHRGLNGYWTRYIVLYPHNKADYKVGSPLEEWILTSAPVVQATQERFQIFRQKTGDYLRSSMTLASIPCGLMDDLLSLDFSPYHDLSLVGIDSDRKSLELARENAQTYGFNDSLKLLAADAWHLKVENEFDLITSNGLSIYEKDEKRLIDLFKEFQRALTEDGILITSFLTPPPALDPQSPWQPLSKEDLLKQKAIFSDILDTKWQAFRSEQEMMHICKEAGLKVEEIIFDRQRLFPTLIARKNA